MSYLEIYHYVPPELLKDVDVWNLPVDEFAYYLAIAREIEDMESYIHSKAISDVFSDK